MNIKRTREQLNKTENEFFLKTVSLYAADEGVYFVDEVTGGIFFLDPYRYTVDVIVSPIDLQNDHIPALVTKFGDKIIGIPQSPKIEWPVFDISQKKLTFLQVKGVCCEISCVERQGEYLYLLPLEIDGEVYRVDLNLLKVVKTYSNVYGLTGREKFYCWGGSNYADTILHPANGTNRILRIKNENVDVITVKEDVGISTVSQNDEGIWLLPESGNFIYLINEEGVSLRCKKLKADGTEWDASEFSRVVTAGGRVFLLPKCNDSPILYTTEDGPVMELQIDQTKKAAFLLPDWQNYFPHYSYTVYAGELCLFPINTSFTVINLDSLSVRNISIQYGATLSKAAYVSWAIEALKEKHVIFHEDNPHDLDEFIFWCSRKKDLERNGPN